MAITIPWQADGQDPEVLLVIDDDTLGALEKLRLTIVEMRALVAGGPLVQTLKYGSVKEMLAGAFLEACLRPAMDRFQPGQLADLMAQRQAIDEQMAAAKTSIEQRVAVPLSVSGALRLVP